VVSCVTNRTASTPTGGSRRSTRRSASRHRFANEPAPETDRLADFLSTLRPGPTADGGQDLLHRAFIHYFHARYEPDRDAKHEHMLLQPYIAEAMPGPIRRLVTPTFWSSTSARTGTPSTCSPGDVPAGPL
jgi:hypothetical protein